MMVVGGQRDSVCLTDFKRNRNHDKADRLCNSLLKNKNVYYLNLDPSLPPT